MTMGVSGNVGSKKKKQSGKNMSNECGGMLT